MKSKEQAQSNIWADVLSQRTWRAAVGFCSSVGLFLLLSNMAHASLSNVSATSLSSADGGSDSTSPFLFTVSYTINTNYSGNGNGRVNGVLLEYDDGGGYETLGACASSGFPSGNTKNGQSGTLEMVDIQDPAAGLAAGTYDLRITVYTNSGNSSGSSCSSDANVATISNFTITGTNSAPVAVNDTASTDEDTALTSSADLVANDTDADGDGLTVTAGTFPTTQSGSLVLAEDGSYTYTPAANFSGTDTVDYTVTDGTATDTGTLTITVADVNDPPVLTGDLAAPIDEGDFYNLTTTDLFYTDSDDDDDAGVTFTVSSLDSALTLTVNGSAASTFTGTQLAARQVTFTHDGAEGDTVTFAVNVEDGNEDSSAPSNSTFTFTVVEVAPSLDHYAISLSSNSASTCGVLAITVTAHNASDGEVATDHNVTLGVSISGPTWNETGSGTIGLTFNGNSVSANLISSAAISNLQVTLTDTTNNAIGIRGSESPTFAFTNAGSSLSFTGPGNLTAGLNNTAPTATIAVTTPADCTAAGTGTLSTAFYFGCLDPSSCVDGQDLTINNQAVSSSSGSPTSVSLGFTNGTSAPFEVNYEDVGQVQLAAAVTIAATGGNPAHTVTGSTTFVSKPNTLSLSVSGNAGTTSSGAGFIPAGTDFTIIVDAKNSDGVNTPNFGQESTPVVPTLSWSWEYPVTAILTDSDFSRTTYSTNGTTDGSGSITGNFRKVGTIAITAVIPGNDYLAAGDILNRPLLNVGRFYPNAFELTNNAGATPSVLDACSSSGFTYFDESAVDIDYKITAKNALGDAISNYDAASGYGVATVSIGVESTADDGVDLASRLSGATSSWSSGVYSVDSSSSRFESSGSSPNAELLANVGVIISDSLDGLNLAGLDFDPGEAGDCTGSCTGQILPSSLRLRHGRLRLAGASGPETVDLPATLETQYYNGSAWIRNTLDDCTSFPELIQFGGAALTAGVTVGSGTSTASYTSLASSTVTLVDGTSGLIFSAPGIGNTGSFQIDFNGLSGLDHLQYDWNGGGKEFPSPATITFGSFRGHDKIIGRGAAGAQE